MKINKNRTSLIIYPIYFIQPRTITAIINGGSRRNIPTISPKKSAVSTAKPLIL
jgi:hypothetical protein